MKSIKMFCLSLALMLPVMALLWLTAASVQAAAAPKVLKYQPGMTIKSLAAYSNNDLVELQNGRRIPLGSLRQLDVKAQQMRAAVPGSKRSALLRFKPEPQLVKAKINNYNDFRSALKRADNETIQLPSGRLVTVGQMKFMQPHIDKKLAALPSSQKRPVLTGPAVKVTSMTDWKVIARMPDNTVLENQAGKRATVGELKQEMMKQSGKTTQPLRKGGQ
jgi:hypothetical protein